MEGFILELIAVGLLVEYECDGQAFLQVTGWHHQRIDRPNYKFPPFDADGKPSPIEPVSTSSRRGLVENSSSPHPRIGKEGKGKEGKGEEGAFADKSPTPRASAPTATPSKPPEEPEPPKPAEPPTPPEGASDPHKPEPKPPPQAPARPSEDEVRAYFAELDHPEQAEPFADHYAANGWVQNGRKPIRDWRAAARQWVRRIGQFDARGSPGGGGRNGRHGPNLEEVILR